MGEKQTTCAKCNATILEVTAEKNNGVCMKCVNESEGKVLRFVESVELGFRAVFGVGFGIAGAVLGYVLGATIWTGVGIVLAMVFVPIGFVYGFFLPEINFCIRLAFKAIRTWFGF